VLARILDPDLYGVVAIMTIFTALADVFIQRGFNTALIQNKDVAEEDYSSVLWVSLGIAGIMYASIFFASPVIAELYTMPQIVTPLRVLALMLFPGAMNSVQLAKVSREMNFKKVFFSNVAATLVSGCVGIAIAYAGGGLWALVAQAVLNVLISCVVMRFTVKLKIIFKCDLRRIGVLFSFGWKLLVSGLIDTLYTDLRSLVIGIKYDSATLGYYDRGKKFPKFIIDAVNGTVQSVMLPALSSYQDDKSKIKEMMRTSMTVSSYIIFPVMAGLAGVATPLISLLLTDKWLPCVPYLQIYCFTLAFYPIHSCNLQAINAMGRSDLFLVLEVIKKTLGIASLVVAVLCFDSPIAIAMTGVVTTFISCFINASPNKKLVGYSYFEQMIDVLPSFVLSLIMFLGVWGIGYLLNTVHPILTIMIQVVVGVIFYFAASLIFKLKPLFMIINIIQTKLLKGRGKKLC